MSPDRPSTTRCTPSTPPTATTSAAYNVTVTDTIPAGVVVDPTSISDGGVLTGAARHRRRRHHQLDPPGPINPGAAVPLTYAATLAPSTGLTTAPQVNQADVTGYDSLPSGGRHYPATPTASATVTPVFPFVQAAKSTPQGTTAYVGEPFTWQITLTNTGAGTAYAVGATDILPPNWGYDNNSARCRSTAAPPTRSTPPSAHRATPWTGPTWPTWPQAARSPSPTPPPPRRASRVSPGVGLSVDQTNSVSPLAQDATGATGNQTGLYNGPTATAAAHIASADVGLTKQVGTQPIAGTAGSWTLTVSNHGPDPATGPFTVTDGFNDPPPAGVSNITASGSGWSCTTDQPLTCTRTNPADTLAVNAAFPPITVSYDVAADVPNGTILANSATVVARTFDPNLVNNTGKPPPPSAPADLAITKDLTSPSWSPATPPPTPSPSPTLARRCRPDRSASPTPSRHQHLHLRRRARLGLRPHPHRHRRRHPHLYPHRRPGRRRRHRQLVVTVGIPSSQTAAVVNTATISATTTPDPNPANNTATVTTTPATSADLKIQKQHVGTFVAGNDAQYTLEVRNFGPSDAADATIADTLPDGVTFLASGNADWTCTATGQQVTCTHPAPLPADTTTTVTLNVHLAPDLDTSVPIDNTATVSSTTPDPDLNNNTSTDSTDINASADLAITKHHAGAAVAGAPFQYTLSVINNGPSNFRARSP